jgi:xanthosine utilization system XapX-like protein
MLFHFGRAFLVLGWILTIAGVIYVLMSLRHMAGVAGASPALLLIGLVAVVVGSSIIRWVRRAR